MCLNGWFVMWYGTDCNKEIRCRFILVARLRRLVIFFDDLWEESCFALFLFFVPLDWSGLLFCWEAMEEILGRSYNRNQPSYRELEVSSSRAHLSGLNFYAFWNSYSSSYIIVVEIKNKLVLICPGSKFGCCFQNQFSGIFFSLVCSTDLKLVFNLPFFFL